MGYDNSLMIAIRKRMIGPVVVCAAVLLMTACGGVPVKSTSSEPGRVTLPKDGTLVYIPVQKVDSEGAVLPYEPMANPYLSQVGQINSKAVDGFIAARRAFKAKEFEKADLLLDAVIENSGNLAGPWVMKGDIAVLKLDLKSSVGFYRKAIEANQQNVNAYIKLAKSLRSLGQYQESLDTYVQALMLWRDFPEAHLNLAILYDLYLNKPLFAQRHMEAYLFLTGEKDSTVASWLEEVKSRTGAEANLVQKRESSASQISLSEGENLGS